MKRGEIWWASLQEPRGSEPGYRRPVVIISSDAFNQSRIRTAIVAVMTSNVRLAQAPGNVSVAKKGSGLAQHSVISVSQLLTLDKSFLTEKCGKLSAKQLNALNEGLKLVLAI